MAPNTLHIDANEHTGTIVATLTFHDGETITECWKTNPITAGKEAREYALSKPWHLEKTIEYTA